MVVETSKSPQALEEQQIAKVYKALGEPNRLRIARLLAGSDEVGCTELAERIGLSRPTLSHHTSVLMQSGLVEVRKEGKSHYFRLRRDIVERYAPAVLSATANNR